MGVPELIVIVASLALAGFMWWFFFGPKKSRKAEVVGGTQEVNITVKGGYSPDVIRVQEGVPLKLTFDRQESGDCTSRVVFADFGASKSLPAFGTATLEFTPDKVGEFGFACGMNMIHGSLIVEPSGNGISSNGEQHGSDASQTVAVAGQATETDQVE
ncbi:MAG: cupredoxin domain-containing protein, partial [Acidimicrobiales bacterium]